LLITSSIVEKVTLLVDGGNIDDIISIKVSCSPSIGMYGIRVKKTIIEGKNAKKKLKARDEALVVIAPFLSPFQKKKVTS
jgi:hypothetical protein